MAQATAETGSLGAPVKSRRQRPAEINVFIGLILIGYLLFSVLRPEKF